MTPRVTARHRHYSIDVPPRFCEECGKDWTAVVDGRVGRRNRRLGIHRRKPLWQPSVANLARRYAALLGAVRAYLDADGSNEIYDAHEMLEARKLLWKYIGGKR